MCPKHTLGPVVQCPNCKLVYVVPERGAGRSTGGYGFYLADMFARQETVKRVDHAHKIRTMVKISGQRGRLLDIGCGNGHFMAEAAKAGYDIYGIEPDASLAAYAARRFPSRVLLGRVPEMPFTEASFDAVTMNHVLEHLERPRAALQGVQRVLRAGGLLVVEVPNIDSWPFRILRGRWRQFKPEHLYFFSPETLARLLKRCGFEPALLSFPSRTVTLEYLGLSLASISPTFSRVFQRVVRALSLSARTVAVNLGDIVACYAHKVA